MKHEEENSKPAGAADAGKAPGRPRNAPERVPGQNIDKANAASQEKDGHVDEDGRGRLTRKGE